MRVSHVTLAKDNLSGNGLPQALRLVLYLGESHPLCRSIQLVGIIKQSSALEVGYTWTSRLGLTSPLWDPA